MQSENNPSNPTTEIPTENIKKSVERSNNTLNNEKEVTVQNLAGVSRQYPNKIK